MDRRAFLTRALLAVGALAATATVADAMPAIESREALTGPDPVENTWWYRRWHWRRRHYWHWRRRHYWHWRRRHYWHWRRRYWW